VIKVLVIDDQELVRTGFALILEAEPDIEVVGEAGDGRAALEQARRLEPDVVLMDVRMPVMDGIEATRRLTGGHAGRPRVIILTTFDLDEYVYAGLAAGASGFLLKDVRAAALAEAIRVVDAGEALLDPAVTRRVIGHFVERSADVAVPVDLSSMTAREVEVLTLIGRGLSNTDIAEKLVLSMATVKTHVGRVFAKLEARDRAQAVIAAYEAGLVGPRR
jgi:DNA-binding NarL/FixJ family response regulator